MSEVKESVDSIGKGVTELQEVFKSVSSGQKSLEEKYKEMGAESVAKAEKIDADLEKKDKAHNELVLKIQEEKEANSEMKERVESLELKLIKGSKNGSFDFKETEEYKAINEYSKYGKANMQPENQKYLRTDSGAQGGYLVPEVLDNEIIKRIIEISDVRRLSRVKSKPGVKTLNTSVRNTIPVATYEGEHEVAPKSQSSYGRVQMTAHRQTIVTEITWDDINFSAYDMQNELLTDAIEAFAFGEGNRFLLGTGVKQPKGILDTGSGVATFDSAASGVIDMVDVINVSGNLKVGYNPIYAFNRKTLTTLRTDIGANGQFRWKFEGETQPTMINGFNYVLLQDMPDVTNSSLSVLFGDFARGYTIMDSVNTMMIRDELTQASQASINFTWHRWNDGLVTLPEAFKILKTKA